MIDLDGQRDLDRQIDLDGQIDLERQIDLDTGCKDIGIRVCGKSSVHLDELTDLDKKINLD